MRMRRPARRALPEGVRDTANIQSTVVHPGESTLDPGMKQRSAPKTGARGDCMMLRSAAKNIMHCSAGAEVVDFVRHTGSHPRVVPPGNKKHTDHPTFDFDSS